ncbi:MAG: hypothetical protein U0166_03830 [Acidobacteriota bacterium]
MRKTHLIGTLSFAAILAAGTLVYTATARADGYEDDYQSYDPQAPTDVQPDPYGGQDSYQPADPAGEAPRTTWQDSSGDDRGASKKHKKHHSEHRHDRHHDAERRHRCDKD